MFGGGAPGLARGHPGRQVGLGACAVGDTVQSHCANSPFPRHLADLGYCGCRGDGVGRGRHGDGNPAEEEAMTIRLATGRRRAHGGIDVLVCLGTAGRDAVIFS